MYIKPFASIKKLKPALFVVLTIVIAFTITDISIALAQLNSNNSNNSRNNSIASNFTSMKSDPDGKPLVITWLEINETTPDKPPIITVTSQEFWRAFSSLLEVSTNSTIDTRE